MRFGPGVGSAPREPVGHVASQTCCTWVTQMGEPVCKQAAGRLMLPLQPCSRPHPPCGFAPSKPTALACNEKGAAVQDVLEKALLGLGPWPPTLIGMHFLGPGPSFSSASVGCGNSPAAPEPAHQRMARARWHPSALTFDMATPLSLAARSWSGCGICSAQRKRACVPCVRIWFKAARQEHYGCQNTKRQQCAYHWQCQNAVASCLSIS